MENQVDANIAREFLNKICSDALFVKSPRYSELLALLVEQALTGNDLKEHTIGADMFGPNYNPVEDDGKVRVYMYNLRKKLNAYYDEEGKSDEVVFCLEKGSYNLKIIARKNIDNTEDDLKSGKKRLPRYLYTLIPAVLVLSIYGIFKLIKEENTYCWKIFFSKDANNMCILADQVILYKNFNNSGNLITRKEINSAAEYISYKKKHTEDTLYLAEFTMFTKAIPFSLLNLSEWFFEHGANFVPQSESGFNYDDVKKGNLIYIGQFKTMSISKEIFLKNSKVFRAEHNHFVFTENGKEIHYSPQFDESLRAEYAMVSYIPIEDGHVAIYFVSNNDIGTMAVVDRFTNRIFLRSFFKNLPSTNSYFNALFRVEGIQRTQTNCKLVKLEILEDPVLHE